MRDIFLDFIKPILALPLWVKEYIYLALKQEFINKLGYEYSLVEIDSLYTNYKPEISFKGKEELVSRCSKLQPNFYKFLDSISCGQSIIEITINNYWTLEEVSKFFVYALESEYIKEVFNDIIIATAFYLSSKIRIGEYFKKLGKIDVDQLNNLLKKIKESNENGTNKKSGELLIELGYATKKDMTAILYIKDESKKRFILDTITNTPSENSLESQKNYIQIEQELMLVKSECNLLKNKLRQIYEKISKKRAEK